MVNQQVIDYIKTEQQKGTDKEVIRNHLLANGWNNQDIDESFNAPVSNIAAVSSAWAKKIPRTNNGFLILYLALIFGLNLFIVISSPELITFWYMMLGVFAAFIVFYLLENFYFKKRFSQSTYKGDSWIYAIILMRNLVFLLNFIPLIQLLGLFLIGSILSIFAWFLHPSDAFSYLGIMGLFGLLPLFLILSYIILMIKRFRYTKTTTTLS